MKHNILLRFFVILVLMAPFNCLKASQHPIPFLDSLLNVGAYQEVISYAQESIDDNDLKGYNKAARWLYAAKAYYKLSDFPACWDAVQKSYALIERLDLGSDKEAELAVDIAQTLCGYAFVAFEYSTGLEAADFSIRTIQSYLCNDPELLTKSYLRKIVLHRANSDLDLAVTYVQKAKDMVEHILSSAVSSDLKITILAEEAQLQSDQYQLRFAINTYLEIIDLAQAIKDTNRLMVYYNNIGIAYFKMGDFGRSESALNKSLQYKLQFYNEYSPTLISNYSNLALVNVWQDQHKEAEEYYHKLLKIVTDQYGLIHIRNATTFYNLGYSYYLRERYAEASEYFHKCLEIRRVKMQSNSLLIADAMNMIGSCANRQGEYLEAIPWFEKALQIRLANGLDTDDVSRDLYTELSEAFYKSGNLEGFKQSLTSAYSSIKYDQVNSPFDFSGMEVPLGLSDVLKLDIKVKMDQWDRINPAEGEDIEHLLQIADSLTQFVRYRFDDIESRRKLISQLKWLHEFELQYNLIRSEDDSITQNISRNIHRILEKSKNVFLYENMADANADELIGMPVAMMEKKSIWSDSIVYYQNLLDDKSATEKKDRAALLQKLNSAKDSLDGWFSLVRNKYPSYYNALYGAEMVALQTVQKRLNTGEFILNYFTGEQYSYVMLIGPSEEVKVHKVGQSTSIKSQIVKFIDALTSRRSVAEIEQLSIELYRSLLPFAELESANRLIIIPDGILGLLPFELLRNKDGTRLFDRANVFYHFSSTMTYKSEVRPIRNPRILSMAPGFEHSNEARSFPSSSNMNVFRDLLVSLPHSLNEAEKVANIFSAKAWLAEQSTKDAFKEQAGAADIIHLATHGFVNHDRPGKSKLYFYSDNMDDGNAIMYANEIVNLKLKAALVVLSACNTGIGRVQSGEGIASLGRAFAYAGASHQVLSLWPVHDHTTSEIMTLFYSNLQKGMGKATALYEAKKSYLSQAPNVLKDPYYWAGLVYYGDDTPLIQKRNNSVWYILGFVLLILLALIYFKNR